jgi:hypothetical protein
MFPLTKEVLPCIMKHTLEVFVYHDVNVVVLSQ